MPAVNRITQFGTALALWVALCGAASPPLPPTVPVPISAAAQPAWQAREQRVAAIARKLLIANAAECPATRFDFGLEAAAAVPLRFGTPLARVAPGSPAEAAGLRRGDALRVINGVHWSPDPVEAAQFDAALQASPTTPRMALLVERDGREFAVTLAGENTCRAEVRLVPAASYNASAIDSTIVIDAGLERLLRDDAELAFAIAHETTHILLGHTAADRQSDICDLTRRRAMEQQADAAALRLMARAGYAPDAAAVAWPKIADAGRPPLARLMDLHGPYMATTERTAFLAGEAVRLVGRLRER